MHPNLMALRAVLEEAGMAFSPIAGFPDSLVIESRASLGSSTGKSTFMYAATPFNRESVAALCRDKAAVHALLFGKVKMPRTMAFIDPNGSRAALASEKSIDEIVKTSSSLSYPLMVKMNQGSRGQNVYFAENADECRRALAAVFNKDSKDYDYIALAQEYIDIKAEFKVAISAGKPVFAYRRADFILARGETATRLCELVAQIVAIVGISWGTVDIIQSKEGELFFIEANTRPGYEGFIAAHGDKKIQELYKIALKDYGITKKRRVFRPFAR